MSAYALEVIHVHFRYPETQQPVLKNIHFTIKPGEIVGIVGLSGSGKTTLINILNGVIPKRISGDLGGQVLLWGKPVSSLELTDISQSLGTIFQDPDNQILFPNTEDELAFGPENLCREPSEIIESITDTLSLLGISHLRSKNPNQVSGGEKQLITVAAILTLDASILIFDESLSFIDKKGRQLVKEAIKKLKNQGKAILMVEHELDNLSLADRIYLLKDGTLQNFEGVIE